MTQTIEIPEGFELKKVSDTEYKIVKKEKSLPKTWEEFCNSYPIGNREYFIGNTSEILHSNCKDRRLDTDRNVLPSKEKAEAILALCQLIQLRDCYNDGWKPDWSDGSTSKHVIYFMEGEFEKNINLSCARILAFKSEELKDKFFDNFKDLIEKLRPLYE